MSLFANEIGVVLDADEYMTVLETMRAENPSPYSQLSAQEFQRMVGDRQWHRLVYSYYMQLRSMWSVTCPEGDYSNPKYTETVKTCRNLAAHHADYLAVQQYHRKILAVPLWVQILNGDLTNYPDGAVTAAWKQIKINHLQMPSIQPSVKLGAGEYELTLPIMVRSFLKQLNTVAVNLRHAIENDNIGKAEIEVARLNANQVYLCHCWFIRDAFHPMGMPYPHCRSLSTIQRAQDLTFLQILFILLHECAHIAMGHIDGSWKLNQERKAVFLAILQQQGSNKTDLTDKEMHEIEADVFAINRLMLVEPYHRNEKIVSILYLLDYLWMIETTTSLEIVDKEIGPNSINIDGHLLERRRVSGAVLSSAWTDQNERQWYRFQHEYITAQFVESLKSVQQSDIDSFTNK